MKFGSRKISKNALMKQWRTTKACDHVIYVIMWSCDFNHIKTICVHMWRMWHYNVTNLKYRSQNIFSNWFFFSKLWYFDFILINMFEMIVAENFDHKIRSFHKSTYGLGRLDFQRCIQCKNRPFSVLKKFLPRNS